ncbi:protein NLRC3-like isoform X1 [Hoplias malabaricus]|uniref:protein NLRC3-like isoform X1 n=1 Tax=Hoplias malabaricus TaxID=27720 RepID=UPI0034628210
MACLDESQCVPMSEDCLQEHPPSLRYLLRERLKKKYQDLETACYVPMKLHVFEGTDERIRTEEVIQGLNGSVHDFLKDEDVIEPEDLFKPCPSTGEEVRTVLMKGISGIGKTTAVKKFVLDWTEGRTYQDITYVLPFSLPELSSVKLEKCSLIQLLNLFFPDLSNIETLKHSKVLFVLDDLSKCRLKLNFWHTTSCSNPAENMSLSALLVNLLRGDLFPEAQILVTSDSADLIPSKYVQRVVEVQGLDDVEWEEYVKRTVGDSSVAARAVIHIKSSITLYFMRSSPVFCQIAAMVLKELMTNASCTELPLTLTELYSHFQLIQLRRRKLQTNTNLMGSVAEEMLQLGKLAWHTLEKGLTVFEDDLNKSDVAPSAAAELSQKWPMFLKEEELTQGNAFHFSHESIQAYLSALYVVMNYEPSKSNVFKRILKVVAECSSQPTKSPHDMLKRAIDKTLSNKEGQFDFFLLFLIGISAGPSHKHLSCFLPDSCPQMSSENIVPYVFKKIKYSSSLNVSLNLIRCLDELNVSYTVSESEGQSPGNVQEDHTPSEWSALAKTLLNSEDQRRIFDFREYVKPDVAFVRLLPVIKASRVLRLCEFKDLSWMLLASALRSPSNIIREIDLEESNLNEKNIYLLSLGWKSANCKVEVLRIPPFNSTFDPLLSALLSNPTHLRELSLSHTFSQANKTMEILVDPRCHLEKLVLLNNVVLTTESFRTLAKALSSSTCRLKELDLSSAGHFYRSESESAVSQLSQGLSDPCCQIRVLRLANCHMEHKECAALISAFHANPSHLRELDLSYSTPGFQVFLQLCSLLKDPQFKLETLILVKVNWWRKESIHYTSTHSSTDTLSEVCKALSSVLSLSSLRVLDLSGNYLKDSSVEQLSPGLGHSACKLEILRMARCDITEVGASSLANSLRLNPSHMRELDLSYNPVEGSGFDQLRSLVEDPAYRLEKITVEGHGMRHGIEKLRQYECTVTLDPNTASKDVKVCKRDKKAWCNHDNKRSPPNHPDRFEMISQVMCREGFTGRHFFQVEWFGTFATIGMAYKDICRKGNFTICQPGYNKKSWAIDVTIPFPLLQTVHNGVKTRLPYDSPWRVGLYLDWPAGSLSFYDITYDQAKLIHTFYAKFTKPLYLIFSISVGISLLPKNPNPVCCHDHDPWSVMRGYKDCKGCRGSKA